MRSVLIKNMIEDLSEDNFEEAIPIPNVSVHAPLTWFRTSTRLDLNIP